MLEIPAHKCVISRIPYFKAIFSNNYGDLSDSLRIDANIVDKDAFRSLMEFTYTDSISFASMPSASETCKRNVSKTLSPRKLNSKMSSISLISISPNKTNATMSTTPRIINATSSEHDISLAQNILALSKIYLAADYLSFESLLTWIENRLTPFIHHIKTCKLKKCPHLDSIPLIHRLWDGSLSLFAEQCIQIMKFHWMAAMTNSGWMLLKPLARSSILSHVVRSIGPTNVMRSISHVKQLEDEITLNPKLSKNRLKITSQASEIKEAVVKVIKDEMGLIYEHDVGLERLISSFEWIDIEPLEELSRICILHTTDVNIIQNITTVNKMYLYRQARISNEGTELEDAVLMCLSQLKRQLLVFASKRWLGLHHVGGLAELEDAVRLKILALANVSIKDYESLKTKPKMRLK